MKNDNQTEDIRRVIHCSPEFRGIVRECGIGRYTLLYLKWITNKDQLYSTGNSAQYSVTT